MTPENTMALSLKIVRAQGPRNFYNPINFLGCENFTQGHCADEAKRFLPVPRPTSQNRKACWDQTNNVIKQTSNK
jgi:hypothetical protein